MPTVADCLRQHGETFLQQCDAVGRPVTTQISLQQRKVLSAITRCRTGELGSVIFECGGCGRQHWVGRSCGNRHWRLERGSGLNCAQHPAGRSGN